MAFLYAVIASDDLAEMALGKPKIKPYLRIISLFAYESLQFFFCLRELLFLQERFGIF